MIGSRRVAREDIIIDSLCSSAVKPYRVDTTAADEKVHCETMSRVKTLVNAVPTELFTV